MKKPSPITHQFGPRLKKRITAERIEEAKREIAATGWKPNARTMAKIADQLVVLESRIH